MPISHRKNGNGWQPIDPAACLGRVAKVLGCPTSGRLRHECISAGRYASGLGSSGYGGSVQTVLVAVDNWGALPRANVDLGKRSRLHC